MKRWLAGTTLALALCGVAASPLFDEVILRGPTSGQITMQTQAAAGTWNWNFPIVAGTSGQVLASGGGVAAPMTWVTLGAVATSSSASDLSTGTLPAARMPAMTGDVTAAVNTHATTLANTAVTAGSYTAPTLTVDAKGRLTAASNGTRALFFNPTVSGNGADLTEDQLTNCNYTIPASTLVNVGDGIRMLVHGNFAATTDNRTARVRMGSAVGVVLGQIGTTSSGVGSWGMDISIFKSSNNNQVYGSAVGAFGLVVQHRTGVNTLTDTSSIALVVTGQNITNSVANSITCLFSRVEFLRAP